MHIPQHARHGVRVLVGGLLLAGTAAQISPAQALAAGVVAGRPGTAVGLRHVGGLNGVAAVSARDVWAVGHDALDPMIVHWNGTAWRRFRSPQLSHIGVLSSVAAVSARNVWAVGWIITRGRVTALIMHWNGTAWRRVPGAALSGESMLSGVAATSASNVWA